jgi:hypothetical protein
MVKSLNLTKNTLFKGTVVVTFGALLAWIRSPVSLSLASDTNKCETPNYNVRVVSFDPLMMHLENFITLREREHLLKTAYVNSTFSQKEKSQKIYVLLTHLKVAQSQSRNSRIYERICPAHNHKNELDSTAQ